MMNLILEGGWGMVPVLVFGLILVATAARYAWAGGRARLRFAAAMVVLLICAMTHAMITNVATVFWALEDPARAADAHLVRTLFTGLKESTRPGALGGALLTFALVLIAIGVYRDPSPEPALAPAR